MPRPLRALASRRWMRALLPVLPPRRASGVGRCNIARAGAAPGNSGIATFDRADMRQAAFPPSAVIVLLDLLHDVTPDEQLAMLRRAREALRPNGALVLRVADAGARARLVLIRWIDRAVARLRGPGPQVRTQPMSQGTPFANALPVAPPAIAEGAA